MRTPSIGSSAGRAGRRSPSGAAGIDRLHRGIAVARSTGTAQMLPYLRVLLAEGCLRARRLDAARTAVEQGLEAMGSGAGVHRGELLRIAALLDAGRREPLLEQADEVARRLSSPWLHERIARSRASMKND